ncbi:hypothetical protein F2Y61_24425 [Phocaeicola dorei]|uniref:Uncharacterized protein n=1 Tax=Phocaeicola dorei TaxID=357276 RepID=A0A5M5ZMB6_9BACT|nr:hypothetical protein [Phocaeicola dorei]KAA5377966.1 hypothetical protein F2Y61_24425 [Phocaeicola dorei]
MEQLTEFYQRHTASERLYIKSQIILPDHVNGHILTIIEHHKKYNPTTKTKNESLPSEFSIFEKVLGIVSH